VVPGRSLLAIAAWVDEVRLTATYCCSRDRT